MKYQWTEVWLEPCQNIPNTQIRVYCCSLLQRGFINNSYTLITCFSRTLLKQESYQPSTTPTPSYTTAIKNIKNTGHWHKEIAETIKNWMMTFHYSFFTCNKIHFHVNLILRFTQWIKYIRYCFWIKALSNCTQPTRACKKVNWYIKSIDFF